MALIVVFPIGVREELSVGILYQEMPDKIGFAMTLLEAGEVDEKSNSPASHVWGQLDDDLKDDIRDIVPQLLAVQADELAEKKTPNNVKEKLIRDADSLSTKLLDALNEALLEEGFYDEDAWEGVELSKEADELKERGLSQLSHEELGRFNRLAMEAAFKSFVTPSPATRIGLSYAIWETPSVFPLRRSELKKVIGTGIPFILDKFVLSIGLVIAIIVTAPILPQTFETGSLHLLLSKPISRWSLLLSKFVGGCAFVTVCAVYLFVGIFLFLGLRIGVWLPAFLWSIPLYVFVFAIYYSVSTLAAVLWRNSIIAVLVTLVFWGLCWGIGYAEYNTRTGHLDARRQTSITEVGDEVFFADRLNLLRHWDSNKEDWELIALSEAQEQRDLEADSRLSTTPPIYHSGYEMLMWVAGRPQQMFGPPQRGTFVLAPKNRDWSHIEASFAPPGIVSLFEESDESVIAVDASGIIFRLNQHPLARQRFLANEEGPSKKEGGDDPDEEGNDEGDRYERLEFPWEVVSPDDFAISNSITAKVAGEDRFALLEAQSGNLQILEKGEDGKYVKINSEQVFETGEIFSQPSAMGIFGDTILVGKRDGEVVEIDADTLEIRNTYTAEEDVAVTDIQASEDGNWFTVLFTNRKLWVFNKAEQELKQSGIKAQGDINAVAMVKRNRVLVGDRTKRVTEYNLEDESSDRKFSGSVDSRELSYRWALLPIYTVFPKPGEFYDTVTYLMTSDDTGDAHPWRPIWSSALFIAFILGLSCWYMHRAEF